MISQTNIELVVLIIAAAFIVFLEMVRIVSTIKDNTKEENLKMVKSWLLSVIINAEKIYGGKTGKVKLSYVYGLFIEKFPKLAKVITFETFSALVDEILKINENFIENTVDNSKVSINVDKNIPDNERIVLFTKTDTNEGR